MKNKLLIGLLVIVGLVSCKKEDDNTEPISESEMVEIVENAYSIESGGLQAIIEESIEIMEEEDLPCNTIALYQWPQEVVGFNFYWRYEWNWQWTKMCEDNAPLELTFEMDGEGEFERPRWKAIDSMAYTYSIQGIQTSDNYTYNGTYEREGTSYSKVISDRTLKTKLVLNSVDVLVSKTTEEILSGKSDYTFYAEDGYGNKMNESGTITYLGDRTAQLITQSGDKFSIVW